MRAPIIATAACLALASPAMAGILFNPKGIFLTEPEAPDFIVTESGQTVFGGPGNGYRRPGRSGFFPQSYDPGLYRYGKSAYGADGFKFEPQPHGKVERKLSDMNVFFWLD
ncbi:MAG: hypothetical protein AAGC79_18105 [Pseudomonadota bacterium]